VVDKSQKAHFIISCMAYKQILSSAINTTNNKVNDSSAHPDPRCRGAWYNFYG